MNKPFNKVRRQNDQFYLAIKEAVYHKEQNTLQDVDDGEHVGND